MVVFLSKRKIVTFCAGRNCHSALTPTINLYMLDDLWWGSRIDGHPDSVYHLLYSLDKVDRGAPVWTIGPVNQQWKLEYIVVNCRCCSTLRRRFTYNSFIFDIREMKLSRWLEQSRHEISKPEGQLQVSMQLSLWKEGRKAATNAHSRFDFKVEFYFQ